MLTLQKLTNALSTDQVSEIIGGGGYCKKRKSSKSSKSKSSKSKSSKSKSSKSSGSRSCK